MNFLCLKSLNLQKIAVMAGLGLIGTLSLSGCGATKAYSGDSRSNTETAKLLAHGVKFHSVNGVPISAFTSSVIVLPGKNSISLSIEQASFNLRDPDHTEYVIEFEAVAGTTYSVTGRRGDGRLCAFPLNPDTGEAELTKPAGCLVQRLTQGQEKR